MIKLMFEKQGKYFLITIKDKKIFYWDKLQGAIWGTSLQYLPPDPTVKKKIQMSRNKIPAEFIDLFHIPPQEMKEFLQAKSDEELKEIVLRDTVKHGCKLVDIKIE